MAEIYPESQLEDLVAAYLAANAEDGGHLEGIAAAGAVFKGFGALELSLPGVVVGVAGSEEDAVTGNFSCALSVSVRCSAEESSVRANQTEREAELRDLCRAQGIEATLNALAANLGLAIRVNLWTPQRLERGATDDPPSFSSTQLVEVETYLT